MILQLTASGRALIDADPVSVDFTRIEFGNGFNYALPEDPLGLTGSLVYTSHVLVPPIIISTVSVRYTIQIPLLATPFDFGEIAFYNQSTLVGVAVSPTLIKKKGPIPGQDGKPLTLEFFIDLLPGNRYATGEVNGAQGGQSFPRVPVVDLLEPPAKNENNAYVIYGLSATDQAFFAFADPTGKWGFSSKTQTFYSGKVEAAGPLGMQASELTGGFDGDPTLLVLQFTTGKLRGYCRVLTSISTGGAIQWNTPFTVYAEEGDDFVIVGPQAVLGGDTNIIGLTVQDEGVDLGAPGTVDVLDFVGGNVEATRTGNKVTVTVTGGGGLPVLYRFNGTSGEIDFNGSITTSFGKISENPAPFVSWNSSTELFDFDHAGTYRVTVNPKIQWGGIVDGPGYVMYGTKFNGVDISLYNFNMSSSDYAAHGNLKGNLQWSDTFILFVSALQLDVDLGIYISSTINDDYGTVFPEVIIEEIFMEPTSGAVYSPPPLL